MDKKVFNNDDYCDVYNGKICDNCGDCLEMQGIDTKAIRIADIAKEVEENKKIEETLKKLAEEEQEEMEDDLEEELTTETWEEYLAKQDEYEDAFDHIEYLEDIDLNDDFEINNLYEDLKKGKVKITNTTKGEDFYVKVELSPYEIEVIKAGGKLNYTKNKLKK